MKRHEEDAPTSAQHVAGHTTAIFTHCVLFGGLGFVFTSTFFDASGFVTSALVDTTNFFAGAFFTATFALAITTLLATVFTTTTSRAGLCATLFALLTAVDQGIEGGYIRHHDLQLHRPEYFSSSLRMLALLTSANQGVAGDYIRHHAFQLHNLEYFSNRSGC